jgi:hypothetical protein
MGAQRPPVRSECRGLGSGMVQVVKQRAATKGAFIPHASPQKASGVAVNSSHRKQYDSCLAMDTIRSAREPDRTPIGSCTRMALCLLQQPFSRHKNLIRIAFQLRAVLFTDILWQSPLYSDQIVTSVLRWTVHLFSRLPQSWDAT